MAMLQEWQNITEGLSISAADIVSDIVPTLDFVSDAIADITTVRDDGNFTDPDVLFIHPHWKQFDIAGIPSYLHYIVGIYISIVGIGGMIGNVIVIWIFCTEQSLRNAPNMYVVNLAISDFVFSAVIGFPLLTIACFNKQWNWGNLACKIYGFLGGLFGLMDINTLALIAIDRYNVVCKPFSVLKSLGHRRAFIQILMVWIWCGAWSSLPFFGIGDYIPEGFQTSCTFDYLSVDDVYVIVHILGMYIGCFLLPLTVIFYCYFRIVRAVFAHSKQMGSTAKRLGAKMSKDDIKMKQEIKTATIAMWTICLFLFCWVPYCTVALLPIFGFPHLVTPVVSELPVLFAKSAALYNPIIYAISHPRYKQALRRRLPWLYACCGGDADAHGTHSRGTLSRGLSRGSSQTSQLSVGENDVQTKPAKPTTPKGQPKAATSPVTSPKQARSRKPAKAGVYVVGQDEPCGSQMSSPNKVLGTGPSTASRQEHDNQAYEPEEQEAHL